MVTVIEHPSMSNEPFEFCESDKPNMPGWTVHAIIERERVEQVQVSKAFVANENSYPTMVTQSEAHTVKCVVYLMRRSIDRTVESLNYDRDAARNRCYQIASELDKAKDEISSLNKTISEYKELVRQKESEEALMQKQLAAAKAMESDIAKLRDHLGKERFNEIVGVVSK